MRPIALLEAAVSCGSPTRGTEHAYEALFGELKTIFPNAVCFPMEKLAPCESFPPHLKHLDTVMTVSRRLRENLLSALSKNLFPLTIGGDHSIAMGSIAALGEYYGAENIALIYIDAHPDFNTEESSESHFIHGMDLASSCGLCCKELQAGQQRVNLLGENIHIIGARSIDEPEYGIMERLGVHCHTAEELHARGAKALIDEILPQIAGKRVIISFDVDFLDPSAFLATGYNLDNGGTWEQLYTLLEPLFDQKLVHAFECVEYNPTLDTSGKDKAALIKLYRFISEKLTF